MILNLQRTVQVLRGPVMKNKRMMSLNSIKGRKRWYMFKLHRPRFLWKLWSTLHKYKNLFLSLLSMENWIQYLPLILNLFSNNLFVNPYLDLKIKLIPSKTLFHKFQFQYNKIRAKTTDLLLFKMWMNLNFRLDSRTNNNLRK